MKKNVLFIPVLLVCLVGCSTKPPQGKTQAESLYLEAQQLVSRKKYIAATEKLNEIKVQHPYSFYATPAELMQADVYFLQENFLEAAAAYTQFRDLHPKDEKIDYVIYRIGLSYYKQLPSTHDRDLSSGVTAITYFKEIVEKYPNSTYVSDSKVMITDVEKKLLEKELYIADFYYRTKLFEAASLRYRGLYTQSSLEPTQKQLVVYRTGVSLCKAVLNDLCLDWVKSHAEEFTDSQRSEFMNLTEECTAKWKEKNL
jgi:outer membrane protein assembly factor BamD